MSDSDSDDDLLSGAPTFSKNTRKETANERKRTNFLDNILNEQEERMQRTERMNTLLEKEKQDFVPNAHEVIFSIGGISSRINGDGSGNGSGDEQNPGSAIKAEDDEMALDTPILAAPPPRRYDINDPAYWDRIKSYAETGEQAALEPDKRRRTIQEAIDGYDMNNDFGLGSLGLAEDGSDGIQSVEEKERRMAELTGKHSNLGTKKTLGWYRQEDGRDEESKFAPFGSLKDAMDELNSIFKTYDCAPQRNVGIDGRKQWDNVRNLVVKPMKEANDVDVLPMRLERDWKPDLQIPEDLFWWLLRVAITGKMCMGTDLCGGAFTMVMNILESQMAIISFNGGAPETLSHVLDLAEFVPMLKYNFGLWTASNEPCSSSTGEKAEPGLSFDEPSGLKHAFEIWTAAIENDQISFPHDFDDSDSGGFGCFAQSVAMVLRCGLDPVFYSENS